MIKNIVAWANREREVSSAIKRVFKTPDGKILLELLLEQSKMLSLDGEPKSYAEECYLKGKRELVNRILLYMNSEYVEDLLQEQMEKDRKLKQEYMTRNMVD